MAFFFYLSPTCNAIGFPVNRLRGNPTHISSFAEISSNSSFLSGSFCLLPLSPIPPLIHSMNGCVGFFFVFVFFFFLFGCGGWVGCGFGFFFLLVGFFLGWGGVGGLFGWFFFVSFLFCFLLVSTFKVPESTFFCPLSHIPLTLTFALFFMPFNPPQQGLHSNFSCSSPILRTSTCFCSNA